MAPPTYADLTASELMYLANRGSEGAAECLRSRALKGEREAVHYLSTGMSGEEDEYYDEWGPRYEEVEDTLAPPTFESANDYGAFYYPNVGEDSAEYLTNHGEYYYPEVMGDWRDSELYQTANGKYYYPEVVGDWEDSELWQTANGEYYFPEVVGDATPPTPLDFLMPHRLLDRAIDSAAARVAPQMNRPVVAPRRPLPTRRMVPPPPTVRFPQWGVFMDYQEQPVETFDTLNAANAYAQATASQFPAGFPIFVIHAGQEPPRAPFGYVSQLQPEVPTPYSSLDYGQDIQSGTRAPSAYEAYQLSQGQRI